MDILTFKSRDLSMRMRGEEVSQIQILLIRLGYSIHEADVQKKYFGKSTNNALKKFQHDNHLPLTGILDQNTANMLQNLGEANNVDRSNDLSVDVASQKGNSQPSLRVEMKTKVNNRYVTDLLKPDILFSDLADLSKLENNQADFIQEKLSKELQRAVFDSIGKVSEELGKVLQNTIPKLNYSKWKDSTINAVVEEILRTVKKNKNLNSEISVIARRLTTASSNSKVSDLLHIDAPLIENPIFREDLHRTKIYQYAKLSKLNERVSRELVDKALTFDASDETRLAELIKKGTITQQQKDELQLTISLAKLTGDNLPFIKALKTESLKSIRDLVRWEKTDWQGLIINEKIPLPTGATVETYAETILFNIEKTYPSHFLLSRLNASNNHISTFVELLGSVNDLLQNNPGLIDNGDGGRWGEISVSLIDWKGVGARTQKKLLNDLQSLRNFVNTYNYLGFAQIINNNKLSIDQKKSTISDRIKLLNIFYNNNPDLDLRVVDFFDSNKNNNKDAERKKGRLNWKAIPEFEQPLLKKQLMAYQRILNLAGNTADRQLLLTNGYDSAMSISRKTELEFIRSSGLDEKKGHTTYAQAQHYALSSAQYYQTIHDIIRGGYKDVSMSNTSPALINDLRKIDGFDELFGPQDFCGCKHCRSILSPAAYFVDLMTFIEENISNPFFVTTNQINHPLYLKRRRSDLWNLKLTCENTDTLVPYLTIVNEVLEAYLDKVVGGDIFKDLSSEQISFSLPFNLPLEELVIYLNHFGISLYEIYRILKMPEETEEKVWRAKLNISQEEFTVITTHKPSSVKLRFGNKSSFNEFNVQEFIRYAGITRQQLTDMLSIRFNPDLSNIIVSKKPDPDELQNFQEIFLSLTNDQVDFIHRFIRLWKKTSWSIPELDLILTALKDDLLIHQDLGNDTVFYVAQLLEIQEKLSLKIEELCTVFHHIPTSDSFPEAPATPEDKKLFERIFDAYKLFGQDPSTQKVNSYITYHHYLFNKNGPADTKIYSYNKNDTADKKNNDITPVLLGGLGISDTELLLLFDLLKNEIPFDPNGECTLDLEGVSLLYRHSKISRALKFKIEDFVKSLTLIFDAANSVVTMFEQIFKLLEFKSWLKISPFSVPDLRFIIIGEESNVMKYQASLETVGTMVKDIQNVVEKLEGVEKEKAAADALLAQITKSFNISLDQLKNTLKWIKQDINSTAIQNTALSAVFTNPDSNIPDHPGDLDALLDLMRKLERVSLLFDRLEFSKETISNLTENPELLGIVDLKQLSLNNVTSLTVYKKLIILNDDAETSVQSILSSYKQNANSFSDADNIALADLWKLDQNLIDSLKKSLHFPNTPIDAIDYLWKCINICKTLGINGFSLQKLVDESDFFKLSLARDIVFGAFSSKYDDEKIRNEKLEPYQDKINIKKRDILCDYIIAREKDLKFRDLHDVYSFFLLDVEMGGCFRTSRLVCGISSLQLYVHRCLVNLERSDPDLNSGIVNVNVDPAKISPEQLEQWEWRKNYRVWEANRKVFLYPENYLEPDLRDNKTPVFKELEDELLQQKITKESAEAAYKKYVSQFAELTRLIIAGSYYHNDNKTYYFFGRTQQSPPQYYYRKWIEDTVWTPWEKIELSIDAPYVSAVIYLDKLYLFWVQVITQEIREVEQGSSNPKGYNNKIHLVFSFINENGKWIAPQKLDDLISEFNPTDSVGQTELEGWRGYKKTFATVADSSIYVLYSLFDGITPYKTIDLFHNKLKDSDSNLNPNSGKDGRILRMYSISPNRAKLGIEFRSALDDRQYDNYVETSSYQSDHIYISNSFYHEKFGYPSKDYEYVMDVVRNKYPELVFTFEAQQFLIKSPSGIIGNPNDPHRSLIRLTTSTADRLGSKLFSEGFETFLDLDTQINLTENSFGLGLTNQMELSPPYDNPNHIDLYGAYGEYHRELFFHIPHLIANHLNANQIFKESKWWYERIFDPTASASDIDRNWRYVEFRGLTIQKMKDILTNPAAITKYETDPFNPYAIARLRLTAFQKSIVMKYIDNLIDWGDYLFAQDTMESINEATMLYVLASDILGRRPVELGDCMITKEKELTYENIKENASENGSEFLIILENASIINATTVAASNVMIAHMQNAQVIGDQAIGQVLLGNGIKADLSSAEAFSSTGNITLGDVQPVYELANYYDVAREKNPDNTIGQNTKKTKPSKPTPEIAVVHQSSTLVFCIPPNDDLLKYWDRVQDRLFKIRSCMNISGVRRQLALFQPPIDPMMLVKAKAAGLSLEAILGKITPTIPPYRFSYLIERAKQFTQTVQSFGSALLSALEKKDVEDLILRKSQHERLILQMTTEIKTDQLREAQYQYQSIAENITNVQQNRVDYYQGLIDNPIGSEDTQQESKQTATTLKRTEGQSRILATFCYLVPQLGSPFALKFGGKELGDSATAASEWLSNMANIADAISSGAGLEATFRRREQEWKHEVQLAKQEIIQLQQQQLAADVRQSIAQNDLDIHNKNIEHTDELDEFYKNKFTSLGLYNYLSTTLNRLYREAFNVAYDLAQMAEAAYQFERDDDNTFFIAGDNWQFDRAGLLAGERLLLQLQQMEKKYLEQNTRDYEVTQSFSLAFMDPLQLINLRQNGSCQFKIPEIMFDLFYPGQYKRLIKSVHITIPCVAGPYTNISAKLSLTGGMLNREPTADLEDFQPKIPTTSIATSNAQNDSGMFELNFKDERYLPFEGAGAAESRWTLELPSVLRFFDYDTISDVIMTVSYTAKDDGARRIKIEEKIAVTLSDIAFNEGLYRLISLKHEFPNSLYQLLHPIGEAQTTKVKIEQKHFPYFLANKELHISVLKVYLKPRDKDSSIDTNALTLKVDNSPVSAWNKFSETSTMKAGDLSAAASLLEKDGKELSIDAGSGGHLVQEEIDDILVLLRYTI